MTSTLLCRATQTCNDDNLFCKAKDIYVPEAIFGNLRVPAPDRLPVCHLRAWTDASIHPSRVEKERTVRFVQDQACSALSTGRTQAPLEHIR